MGQFMHKCVTLVPILHHSLTVDHTFFFNKIASMSCEKFCGVTSGVCLLLLLSPSALLEAAYLLV